MYLKFCKNFNDESNILLLMQCCILLFCLKYHCIKSEPTEVFPNFYYYSEKLALHFETIITPHKLEKDLFDEILNKPQMA